jgi:DNA modification methylase
VDPEPQIDRAAELREKWQTVTGQRWRIGAHEMLCGDWANSDYPQEGAYVLLTDPPYGMNLDADWSDVSGTLGSIGGSKGTLGRKYERVIGDQCPFDIKPVLTRFDAAKEMFLFGGDYYIGQLGEGGSWLVWDKRKESQADAIGSEFELCWSRTKHKRRILRHDWFGFLSSENGAEAHHRMHPTQKPSSLFRDIIEQWIDKDWRVYDPFCGSGTTLVACEQLKRTGCASELDPGYAAVALERLALLGLAPELISKA